MTVRLALAVALSVGGLGFASTPDAGDEADAGSLPAPIASRPIETVRPAAPEPAEVGTRVDATSTTIGAFHAPNNNRTSCDDNYGEILERLNVNGSHGNWVAGLRLDASAYVAKPRTSAISGLPRPCLQVELANRYQDAFIPEKVWAGWQGRQLELTLGDSYVSFGRGLSLSLRKTDELGLDTTQRGLRAKLSTDRLTGTLVAGFTNIGNLDEASGRSAEDPNDLVVGGQLDVRLVDSVRLGGHLVSFAFNKPVSTNAIPGAEGSFQERWLNVGPTFDAPRLTRWLGVYLEGIGQFRRTVNGELQSGFGVYGNSTIALKQFTVLLEGKVYGDLAVVQPKFENLEFEPVQYTSPPTVERVLQEIEHPQRNVFGGRVKVDWSISPNLAVFINAGVFRDDEGFLDPQTIALKSGTIYDPYAGVDARVGPVRIQATGGWRSIYLPEVAGPVRSDGHVDVNLVAGFSGGSSVELHVVHLERRKVLAFADENWREGTLSLGYRRRPWFALSGLLDYTTETGMPSVWYPGGTAELNLTESSAIRLFVGASRGGLRCVSGVCRIFPPFRGAKATITLRF